MGASFVQEVGVAAMGEGAPRLFPFSQDLMFSSLSRLAGIAASVALVAMPLPAQNAGAASRSDTTTDPIRTMVARLDLARYKGTVKGLTQFGDRRQGTARNRAAVDWIEAQ
ncbi:MAG: hypothetical protein ACREOJ_12680, partial [Gemmatimonadaceae bacterium]